MTHGVESIINLDCPVCQHGRLFSTSSLDWRQFVSFCSLNVVLMHFLLHINFRCLVHNCLTHKRESLWNSVKLSDYYVIIWFEHWKSQKPNFSKIYFVNGLTFLSSQVWFENKSFSFLNVNRKYQTMKSQNDSNLSRLRSFKSHLRSFWVK